MSEIRKKPLNDNTAAALDEVVAVSRDQAVYLRNALDHGPHPSLAPRMQASMLKLERGIAYIESLLEVRQNKKAPTADSDGW